MGSYYDRITIVGYQHAADQQVLLMQSSILTKLDFDPLTLTLTHPPLSNIHIFHFLVIDLIKVPTESKHMQAYI